MNLKAMNKRCDSAFLAVFLCCAWTDFIDGYPIYFVFLVKYWYLFLFKCDPFTKFEIPMDYSNKLTHTYMIIQNSLKMSKLIKIFFLLVSLWYYLYFCSSYFTVWRASIKTSITSSELKTQMWLSKVLVHHTVGLLTYLYIYIANIFIYIMTVHSCVRHISYVRFCNASILFPLKILNT